MKTITVVFIVLLLTPAAFAQSDIFSAKSLFPVGENEEVLQQSFLKQMNVNQELVDTVRKKIDYYKTAREKLSQEIISVKIEIDKKVGNENEKKERLFSLNSEAAKIDEYIKDLYELYLLGLKGSQEQEEERQVNDNGFSLNPNVGLNTSGNQKNSFVPELCAGFEKPVKEKSKYLFSLKLNIKSPAQGKDSSALFTGIMKSGADGSLDISLKRLLFNNGDYGGLISAGNRFCWMYTKDNDTVNTSAYVFNSLYGFAAIKLFTFIIGLDIQYSVARKSTNTLTALLNDSWNANLLFGIKLSDYQILIKYLLWNNKLNSIVEDNRLEIKFGVDFNPF